MKKKLFASLILLLIIGGTVFAQRGPRSEKGFDRGFDRGDRPGISERLDLSDDQQIKFDALKVTHIKSTQELHDQLREKQVKLDGMLNDDKIDQKAVDNLVKEIGGAKTELMKARISHKIEVRSLLNDEQKIKFDMMANHRGYQHQKCRF